MAGAGGGRQRVAPGQRYRPETLGAVPTVLAAALHVPRADADIASLQRISGGGSAIPVAVARAYAEQFGLPVLEVYGMTETLQRAHHQLSGPRSTSGSGRPRGSVQPGARGQGRGGRGNFRGVRVNEDRRGRDVGPGAYSRDM